MARFVSLDDARAFARRQNRLTLQALMKGLGASERAASSFLDTLQAEGLIGPAEEGGVHRVRDALAARRGWSQAEARTGAQAGPGIDELRAEIARLKALAEEAEGWKQRALQAEARLAAQPGQESGQAFRVRVTALRRTLARELHPDAPHAPAHDRALYTEMFKTIWPRIEAALRSNGAEDDPGR